ncbi:MAG: ACT domain-containing protein [Deltaproteobacteria bacterium]
MAIKQISVFLENKAGRLAEVTKILGENNININALSIADTAEFGILRLIVSDSEKVYKVLSEAGFSVSSTDVIAIAVDDEPGGLGIALKYLEEAKVDIEYIYAFVGKTSGKALVILRVEDWKKSTEILEDKGIKVLSEKEAHEL